jgi:hypothetical protein
LFVVTILSPISALGQNTTDNMTLGNTTNETGIENATDVGKTSSLLGGGVEVVMMETAKVVQYSTMDRTINK